MSDIRTSNPHVYHNYSDVHVVNVDGFPAPPTGDASPIGLFADNGSAGSNTFNSVAVPL